MKTLEAPIEVTWQEAIEAWVGGKCVKSVLGQDIYLYNESQGFISNFNVSLDEDSDILAQFSLHSLTKEEVLHAKWYII